MKVAGIKVDIKPEQIARLRGLGKGGEARKQLTQEVARMCDPYIPMAPGAGAHLKNAAQVFDGYILYNSPYAHYQWYGEVMAGRAPKHYTGREIRYSGAPQRGAHWEARMWADHGDEIVESLAKKLGGKSK